MKFVLVAACLGLGAGLLPGFQGVATAQRKGKQEVVGAVWAFEAKESAKRDAKVIEKGRFRATEDGRLYTPKNVQIGTYAYTNKAQDKVKLKITQGKLKGESELVKRGLNPPTWYGDWKLEDGTTARLNIQMIKD